MGAGLTLLEILPGMRLNEVIERLEALSPGIPDCALPIEWAYSHRITGRPSPCASIFWTSDSSPSTLGYMGATISVIGSSPAG